MFTVIISNLIASFKGFQGNEWWQHKIFEKFELLLLKIFQETNLGHAWKQNEEKDVIKVYCM